MTENLRIIALQAAVAAGDVGLRDSFLAFLMGAGEVFIAAGVETKPANTAKAPKETAAKEEPKVKPKPAAKEEPKVDLVAQVKGAIKSLLENSLREQCSELLKAHGAASATSLAEKGPEAVEAFIAAANDLILNS